MIHLKGGEIEYLRAEYSLNFSNEIKGQCILTLKN